MTKCNNAPELLDEARKMVSALPIPAGWVKEAGPALVVYLMDRAGAPKADVAVLMGDGVGEEHVKQAINVTMGHCYAYPMLRQELDKCAASMPRYREETLAA